MCFKKVRPTFCQLQDNLTLFHFHSSASAALLLVELLKVNDGFIWPKAVSNLRCLELSFVESGCAVVTTECWTPAHEACNDVRLLGAYTD